MVLWLLSFKVCAVLTLIRENMPIIRVQICHCLNECSICRTGQTLTLAISRCSLQSWQIFTISLMFHLSPSTYKISSPWTFFFVWRQRKTFMIANVRVSHGTWIGLDRLGCLHRSCWIQWKKAKKSSFVQFVVDFTHFHFRTSQSRPALAPIAVRLVVNDAKILRQWLFWTRIIGIFSRINVNTAYTFN